MSTKRLSAAGLTLALLACNPVPGDTATAGETAGETADVGAGATVVVAIVNPVVNDPHNTGVPSVYTDGLRDGLLVDATPGDMETTVDGLAVVGVPVEPIEVAVDGVGLPLDVIASGDVYDAPIAFDGNAGAAEYFANTPIRYAVGEGGGAIYYDTDVELSDVEAKLSEDDVIVVLRPGVYTGSLTIAGRNVLLFGEGWSDYAVVLDGSLTVNGGDVRVRGLTITGDLAAKGNNFGTSFSRVLGDTSITGNAGAYVRNVFCGEVVVPSSNATLLDNYGVAPIEAPPAGACDPVL